ncbi:MAG: hypothetical protein WCC53_04945, partial [Thermoanaerobaculia bacterium]
IGKILEEEMREGDLLLTMGAGDVNHFGEEFLREKKVAVAPPPPTPSRKSSLSESESKSKPEGSGQS